MEFLALSTSPLTFYQKSVIFLLCTAVFDKNNLLSIGGESFNFEASTTFSER